MLEFSWRLDDLAYQDIGAVCPITRGMQMLRKGGSAMSVTVLVVLTWTERIAAAIAIAIPAVRAIASELDSAKAESARIRKGDE